MNRKQDTFDQNQHKELCTSLLYLNMRELKHLCLYFSIPPQGEKIKLIENIQTYLTTGKIIEIQTIPTISKAIPKKDYPLAPQTVILKGAFKNDLKTRIFLKKLIGNHFHYTAYGIDWIKDRWMQGLPPTYEQFAAYWQSQYLARQTTKAALKPEWAYLNFLDRYQKHDPTGSKKDAITAWNIERQLHVDTVKKILNIVVL